jgi:hypothetical protein
MAGIAVSCLGAAGFAAPMTITPKKRRIDCFRLGGPLRRAKNLRLNRSGEARFTEAMSPDDARSHGF